MKPGWENVKLLEAILETLKRIEKKLDALGKKKP